MKRRTFFSLIETLLPLSFVGKGVKSPPLSNLLPSLDRGGRSLGNTNETWYPLTRIWPVYFSSKGGMSVSLDVEGEETKREDMLDRCSNSVR